MKARVRYVGGKNNWGFIQNAIYDVSDEDGYGGRLSYWVVLNENAKAYGMAFMKDMGEIVTDEPSPSGIDDGLFEI